MSGLAALYHRDGRPVDEADLAPLAATLAHRAIDGSESLLRGPVGLLHARFWTTPEALGERQPVRTHGRSLHLMIDGRIDNRDELIADLRLGADARTQLSDARLALRVYEAWGSSGLSRLVGPMALVLYDRWRDRLFLWRDAVGGRGLFYHLSDRLLVVGSEPQTVLAHPAVDDRLDDQRLASMFAASEPATGATFFGHVREVPPGHCLAVSAEKSKLEAWWQPSVLPRLRYGSDDDYADHYLDLLEQAMSCRLRASQPPSLMLSGGLDSAAMAAGAAYQTTTRPVAISWGFDRHTDCDERWASAPLVAALGLDHRIVNGDRCWPLSMPGSWPRNPNTPEENGYRRLVEAVYTEAAQAGSRVVLSGVFGDQLFLGSEGNLWSLLRDGRLRHAATGAFTHARRAGLVSLMRHAVAGPLAQHLIARHAHNSSIAATAGRRLTRRTQPWLTEASRSLLPALEGRDVSWARRPIQARAMLGTLASQGVVHESWHAARAGVEVRLPMRDARLLTFMLQIPAAQLDRPGHRRPIVRRALSGRVPELVRCRQDKTSMATLFRHGVAAERAFISDLLQSPDALWPRFVDRAWLLEKPLADVADWSESRLFVLWLCICAEAWQQRRHSRATTLCSSQGRTA